MGTIVEKSEYLTETKDKIKESINNLGGNIDNSTTFREYAQELQDIYDNIPKTTDTGTNLSLNTIKGKMGIIPKGDTSQNGTPTPDNPVNIEVVTGDNIIKVENKNLLVLDFDTASEYVTINPDDSFSINNTSASTKYPTIKNIPLEAGTYTMLFAKDSYIGNIFIQRNNDNAYNFYLNADNKYRVFTFTEAGVVKFQTNVPANTQTGTIKMMLLKGSYTFDNQPTYIPHAEQTQLISLGLMELAKIGTYQDYLYKSGGKWYKKERNSNELAKNMNVNSVTELGDYVRIQLRMSGTTFNNPSKSYCNYAIYKDGYSLQETHHYTYQNYLFLFIPKSELSSIDIAGATNYINTHTINVIYTLATPQDIEITNETLIEQLNNLDKMYSYNGVTNISSNGNLPIVLGVRALKGE